jgi:hypothetical protein
VDDANDAPAIDDQSVSIAVLDGNQAPIAIDQTFAIPQTAHEVGQFQATDPNGDTLSYAIDDPAFAIDADGLITVANSALLLYGRSHNPTVTITDPNGAVTTASVTIDIHFVLDIGVGWNFVSLPIDPDAPTIDALFAVAPIIGRVLQFDSGQYKIADSAQSEIGYWFYAARAGQLSIPGPLADNIIDFPAGWSTFGPAT